MRRVSLICNLIILLSCFTVQASKLYFAGKPDNDLYRLLSSEGIDVTLVADAETAVIEADKGSGVIISAPGYPEVSVNISDELLKKVVDKKLRVYAEYVSSYPSIEITPEPLIGTIERGVVSSDFFAPDLKKMDIFGINGCHIFPAQVRNPLLSFARAAGYDYATFGLNDTEVYPLLWRDKNNIVAQTCLTNFVTSRHEPASAWKSIWTHLLRWLCNDRKLSLGAWPSDPHPTYKRDTPITSAYRRKAIERGAQWIGKAHLLLHPSWRDTLLMYQGDGVAPWGPPINKNFLLGNGSAGVLEGHGSSIDHSGHQNYRYWLRADVQGEVAFLMASAAKASGNNDFKDISENLLDYLFYSNDFISGSRKNPGSEAYGLIGWAQTHDYVYYNDDNARCILGAIGASSLMDNPRWNRFIVDCIMANFSFANTNGFLPDRFEQPQIDTEGRSAFSESDLILPHPHFESWMWACYLWLYDKTGYKPLLDKAKNAISLTMEAYPDKWNWTNGIQQERARMILPLAWLVRVEDTPEHRHWLGTVAGRLLENQDACGAIREELGDDSLGIFGKATSNRDYGVREAPLIEKNGNPVADMLYTCNFAFFALNEAFHATAEEKYGYAVRRLGDFLVRIQAESASHPDIDGAWMRAFDYDRWDYWASNSDSGWGAWSTLSGWIQSWIVSTLALSENNTSFWEITEESKLEPEMKTALMRLNSSNE